MDRVISYELDLFGSHGMAASDYPAMLDLVVAGRLQPGRLITRRIGLDEAVQALPAMATTTVAGITVVRPA